MAAVPEDEESLLASGRESEDLSRGLGKIVRRQGRHRSFLQHHKNRIRVATLMILAVLATVFVFLWMLYVCHP